MDDFRELMLDKEDYVDIRDGYGRVFTTTSEPAVVFDLECNVLLKAGSFEAMMHYLSEATTALVEKNTFESKLLASCMAVLVLPRNQELVDRIINNTGYLDVYIKKATKLQETENKR